MKSLQGYDMYRMNDLVKTATVWQKAAVWTYPPSSQTGTLGECAEAGKPRLNRVKMRGGTMTMAGWSDAAFGDQSALGICRLRYVIGLMSLIWGGARRIFKLTSNSPAK